MKRDSSFVRLNAFQVDVLERVEISDDEDDDFEYKAVDDGLFGGDDDDDEEDDLAAALASAQISPEKPSDAGPKLRAITQVQQRRVFDYKKSKSLRFTLHTPRFAHRWWTTSSETFLLKRG